MSDTPTTPTPRTDAFIMAHLGWCPTDWNWRLFARQLERENAALREALSGRTVSCERCNDSATLRDQLRRICLEGFGNQDTIGGEAADDYVLRRLTAMREAIQEAITALFRHDVEAVDLESGEELTMTVTEEDQKSLRSALAKLQPFATP